MNDEPEIVESDVADDAKVYGGSQIVRSAIGSSAVVGNGAVVLRSSIGSRARINRRNFVNDSTVGTMTYTGIGTTIHAAKVGAFCSIAGGVDIGGLDHRLDAATTYTEERFGSGLGFPARRSAADNRECCVVGSDVWIGSHAVVLGKASLGHGSVVGAGAVVTKPVPPYAIAVGVPAKVVSYRFDEDVVDRLLRLGWWDWPLPDIERCVGLLTQPLNDDALDRLEEVGRALSGASSERMAE